MHDSFEDLDELQPDWLDADGDMNSPIPDGTYQMRIEKVGLTRTKTTNKPMVTWELEVLGPHHEGRHVFSNQVIHGDDAESRKRQLSFVKSRLVTCRVNLVNLRDLADEDSRKPLLDLVVEVRKTTTEKAGETYDNYIFLRLIDTDLPGSSSKRGW